MAFEGPVTCESPSKPHSGTSFFFGPWKATRPHVPLHLVLQQAQDLNHLPLYLHWDESNGLGLTDGKVAGGVGKGREGTSTYFSPSVKSEKNITHAS